MIKVAILGGSGYTALELIRLLLRHPQAEIVAVTSRQEGKEAAPLVRELHPSLHSRISLRCETFDADRLAAKGAQCVFACLPHGASMSAVATMLRPISQETHTAAAGSSSGRRRKTSTGSTFSGTATQNQVLTAGITDADGVPASVAYRWQSSPDGSTWTDLAATTPSRRRPL